MSVFVCFSLHIWGVWIPEELETRKYAKPDVNWRRGSTSSSRWKQAVRPKPAKTGQQEPVVNTRGVLILLPWVRSEGWGDLGGAFLFQSDNLLSYLTVEETLTYTAQLALQKHSAEALRKKVTPPREPFPDR